MVLLLLLLLLFGPGGSPCHALGECRANITVTAQDTAGVNITTVRDGGPEHIMTTLFVQPRPGFQGVSLVGKVSDGDADEVVVAWLLLNETCFPHNNSWWELIAEMWKVIYTDGVTPDHLGFGVTVGYCYGVCHRGLFRNVSSLQVRAHGASLWKLKGCGNQIPVENNRANSPLSCLDPPPTPPEPHAPTPTTTPPKPPPTTSLATPAAKAPTPPNPPHTISPTTPTAKAPPPYVLVGVGVGVGVAMLVVVVVVLVLVRRRRRQMRTDADQQRTSPAAPGVTEEVVNNLYEPFDRPAPSCVREEVVNNLYEPFDRPAPSCVREEVVNSLYEPFDRPAPSCVREEVVNSLYEPFDSLRQPPPAVTAPTHLQK